MTREYSLQTHKNVCELVVEAEICAGCGICAALCPAGALSMEFNCFGEYIAVLKGDCLPGCSMCLDVCPFSSKGQDESSLASKFFIHTPAINHNPVAGYYIDAYFGYSKVGCQRINGASGGLATWLLTTALKLGHVDRVVCVAERRDHNKLFAFTVFDNSDDVQRASKSCYYPVEMSEVISQIIALEARYAVIGVPCFLKGLRLAMAKNKQLSQRIVLLAGLVCGQLKSKFFAEYLARLSGLDEAELIHVSFREKDLTRPVDDFYFLGTTKGDSRTFQQGRVYWKGHMGTAYNLGYFRLEACNFCDDIFAEVADVTFMDAWLPEIRHEPRGTSIVLVRAPVVKEMLLNGRDRGELILDSLRIERVIESQCGTVERKRNELSHRLWRKRRAAQWFPEKRVSPVGERRLWVTVLEMLQERMIRLSKKAFLAQKGRQGLAYFHLRMLPLWLSFSVARRFRTAAYVAKITMKRALLIVLRRTGKQENRGCDT